MKLANESTFLVGHPSKSQRDKTGRQGGGKINVSQSWFHSLKSKNPYGWRYLGQPEKDVMKANISFIFTYIYQVSKVYPRTRPKIPRSIYLRLYRLSSASLGLAHKSCLRRQDRNSDLHVDVSKWPLCLIAHKPCLQARRAEPEGNRYPTVTPSLNCDSVHLKTYPAHLKHHLISCFLTTFARPPGPLDSLRS